MKLILVCLCLMVMLFSADFAQASSNEASTKPLLPFYKIMLAAVGKGVEACQAKHVLCAFAIYDEYGTPLFLLRQANVRPLSISLAESKAYTSAFLNVSTAYFDAFNQPNKPFYGMKQLSGMDRPQLLGIPGGIPMTLPNGEVIGIGVSDEERGGDIVTPAYAQNDVLVSERIVADIHKMIRSQKTVTNLKTIGLDKKGKTASQALLLIGAFNHLLTYCHSKHQACAIALVNSDGSHVAFIQQNHTSYKSGAWVIYKAKAVATQSQKLLVGHVGFSGVKVVSFGAHHLVGLAVTETPIGATGVLEKSRARIPGAEDRVITNFLAYIQQHSVPLHELSLKAFEAPGEFA